jgi:predicted ATPase
VQWVDPSTLEVMQTLALQGSSAPLLLLCVARPEFRPPWPLRAHHSQITLGRLSRGETDQLVRAVSASDGLSGSEIEGVIDRADGVPLFAEELTRFMLEGAGRGAPREIPATLFDSLAARLDRLGSAREVAQLGAVLGREFSYELISAVSSAPEHQLQADLEKLVDGDVILARGLPPYANYMFKHALLQDAAYGALLKSRRRELHASVARTITAEFTSLAHTQPEILARHWTEAGEAGPAVAAWGVAGESALARRAFKEAEGAFRSAVVILLGEKASPERDAQELALVSQLARVLVLTRGYAAPETVEAAGRAKALAEKFGSVSQLIREEGRIWQATVTAGDYAGAAALADHIMDLARGDGESPQRLIFAHNAQLQTRFYTGDLAGVEEHFALMSPLIDQAGARQAPGNNVISIGVASLSAWTLGHSDMAHERAARAAAMAQRSQHPYDLAMSLHFQGLLHVCERDAEGAASAAERLLALAEANGLDYAGDLARATLGWARARLGATKIGLELLIRVRAESTGARVGLTFGLTMAAEVQALAGQYQRTLEVFEEALTANPQERVFRPFTLAARAEFLTAQGDAAAAEANFRDAVATARTMGAKAWEWRATAGLARLLAARGAAAAGRELVEPLLAEGAGHGREIAELARELGLRPA